jgi:hypothetical protein
MRRTLPAVLLLAACTGQPRHDAPTTAATATAASATAPAPSPPVEPATPAPHPEPAPPVVGKPFHRPGDRADQLDGLTFWGFSKDGRYFAFETAYAGPGATVCEGQVDLFIVDADTDSFPPDGHIEIRPKHADIEPCDPPDLQAAMDAQRPVLLRKYGIEPGHLLPPAEPLAAGEPRPGVERYKLPLPSGGTGIAELEVLDGGRETAHEGKGAAFKLSVTVGEAPPLLIEPGQRRRPYIWDYDFGRGLAFYSPDRSHAALLTATIQLSFEGDRTSYLANGIVLPASW